MAKSATNYYQRDGYVEVGGYRVAIVYRGLISHTGHSQLYFDLLEDILHLISSQTNLHGTLNDFPDKSLTHIVVSNMVESNSSDTLECENLYFD